VTPWPTYATNQNHLNNFGRGPPRDHSCWVWSNSHKRFKILEVVWYFPYIIQYKVVTYGAWSILIPGHVWTHFVEDLYMMLYAKYESSGPCSFRQRYFWKLHFENLFFWPRDLFMQPIRTIWTLSVGDHLGTIPVEFGQILISGSGEEDVWTFPFIIQCKIVPPGWGQFWPHGHNLNNFGRGPLDDVIYQIWKLWTLSFQTRRFLKIAFWRPILWPCDLLRQPIRTVWTILIEDYPEIIPVEFVQIPISGSREEVV